MKPLAIAALPLLMSTASALSDHLVTRMETVIGCKTQQSYDRLYRSSDSLDVKTAVAMIRAHECIMWSKGTVLHLDESIPGDPPLRIRGITSQGVHVRAENNPQAYIIPFSLGADAELTIDVIKD